MLCDAIAAHRRNRCGTELGDAILQRGRLCAGLLVGQWHSNATREPPMVIREAGTNDYPGVMELARALARHVEDPDPGGSADGLRLAAGAPHPWFECLV